MVRQKIHMYNDMRPRGATCGKRWKKAEAEMKKGAEERQKGTTWKHRKDFGTGQAAAPFHPCQTGRNEANGGRIITQVDLVFTAFGAQNICRQNILRPRHMRNPVEEKLRFRFGRQIGEKKHTHTQISAGVSKCVSLCVCVNRGVCDKTVITAGLSSGQGKKDGEEETELRTSGSVLVRR